jgi:hypothetical protein
MKVLTDWFPPEVKPVREGLYISRDSFGLGSSDGRMTWWNGHSWSTGGVHFREPREWRGLAFDPEAATSEWGWWSFKQERL